MDSPPPPFPGSPAPGYRGPRQPDLPLGEQPTGYLPVIGNPWADLAVGTDNEPSYTDAPDRRLWDRLSAPQDTSIAPDQPSRDERRKKRRELVVTVIGCALIAAAVIYVQWPKGSAVPAGASALSSPSDSLGASGTPSASASATPSQTKPGQGTTATTADPSGVPMPVGDIPGWHQVFADDFAKPDLQDKWNVYSGQPGGDPVGWFSPSHVHSGDGLLTITGSKENTPNGNLYATGGVSNSKVFSQTYGRFEVRFRMDKGYGLAYALLLWPSDNTWPPEIDIAEDNAKDRTMTSLTVHYGANNSMIHREIKGDFSVWHTASVDWSPGKLVYSLDGNIWATINSSNVPSTPMGIAIQSQAWPCGTWEGCPNASTPAQVNLEIDWVVAYKAN